jgi:hypothetical protein
VSRVSASFSPRLTSRSRYEDDILFPSIDYLERCALGLVSCPPRPLIVTEWWYIRRMDTLSPRGETVWMGPIIDSLEDLGYTLVRFSHYDSRGRVWRFLSLMSEFLHMYWTGEGGSFECLNHPRCVRPEDYTPHPNASMAYDLETIPASELGTVPAFRVFSLSFWGSRPDNYNGMQIYAKREWGMTGGEDEWAWHVLGQKFQITPFAYPGHTQIPMTIEKACLESPYLPYEEREDAVAILGKQPSEFTPWSLLLTRRILYKDEVRKLAQDRAGHEGPRRGPVVVREPREPR